MKVFITGHKGYIGAHLTSLLKEEGHTVTACDIGYFSGCEWGPLVQPDTEILGDVAAVTERDLEGHDCVMHLAAISNDPMGDIDEALTYRTNRDASIQLAAKARNAGVSRFLFSSSCSIYGKGETLDLDDGTRMNPISAYARSKVETEEALSSLATEDFSPAYLRNATAYGDSPMLRIDLVANNLLACAIARGDIRIMSDGQPWRPLIHCKDIARAFIAFMHAPRERIHNRAVNVGDNAENYQVRQVGDEVQRLAPEAKIVYTGEVGVDPRDYRVKFDLLNTLLPDFRLQYSLRTGLEELHKKFKERTFNLNDFDGDRFVRLRTLKKVLQAKAQAAQTR
jgi:nucleoside-diphosphate-sugar epimerase